MLKNTFKRLITAICFCIVLLLPQAGFLEEIPAALINHLKDSNKHYSEKKYELSIQSLKSAETIAVSSKLDDYLSTIYINFGYSYLGLKNSDQAYVYFKKSLPYSKKESLTDNLLKGLGNLFILCRDNNWTEEELKYAYELEPYYREGKDYQNLFYLLLEIGILNYEFGNFPQAKEYYIESLALAKNLDYKDQEAKLHLRLGLTLHYMGDVAGGISETSIAMDYYKSKNDSQGMSDAYNNLGFIYKRQARYKQALKYYNDALVLLTKVKNEGSVAVVLSNIGSIYLSQCGYESAIEYYKKALSIHTRLKDLRAQIVDSLNLASVYFYLQKYNAALAINLPVLDTAKKLKAKDLVEVILNNIGNVYESLGNYAKALKYYEESYKLIQNIGKKSSEGFLLINLANLKFKLNKLKEASMDYKKALDVSLAFFDDENTWLAYYGLGKCNEKSGDMKGAYKNYLKSVDVIENVRNFIIGGEEDKALYLENKVKVYRALILLLMKMGKFTEAFEMSEKVRARTFLDLIGQAKVDLRKNIPKNLKEKEDEIKKETINLKRQLSISYGRDREVVYQKLIRAQKEYINLLDEIKLNNPEYANLYSMVPLKLNEIYSLLKDNTALIDYYLTEDKLFIWIIKKNFFKSFTVNAKDSEVENLISQLRNNILDSENSRDNKWLSNSQKLYNYLIAPIINDLNDVKKVAIVPHVSLHYLPFEVLYDGKKYLLEKNKILYYLPSVSTYKYCRLKINKDEDKLLAFGNPYLGENGPPPLINAEIEVKKIGKEFVNKEVLTGKKATETVFKNLAGRFNILHLATHASLNADNPLFSRVYLASDGQNDGQLEVHEVFEMNLTSKVVLLSACQTALKAGYTTQFPQGDDLVGLSRSFIYAGTPSVIASLWNVADKPTEELMVAFYKYYKNKQMGEALNLARLEILRKYQLPFFWAPFVFIGVDE